MLNRLYSWYGKRVVLSVLGCIILLVGIALFLFVSNSAPQTEEQQVTQTSVQLSSVQDILFSTTFASIGTVQAVSEARLQTEAGGRVTAVNVEIGDAVRAGQILASIENSAQRASVLQAEGAYEAALASAESSSVGVESAESTHDAALASAITTYQSAYITVDSTLHNDIDELFTISSNEAIGLRIDGQGQANALIAERNTLNARVLQWGEDRNSATQTNIVRRLEVVREDIARMADFVQTLSTLASEQDTSSSFSQTDKDALEAALLSARVALNAELQAIEAARTSIDASEQALKRAEIAGSSGVASASSAQVKIALGSLRAAQANYEKTLVRTPIAGVVNALYLKAGEYVTPSQQAAIVANNNGLEIVTQIGEDERAKLAVGDLVSIDKTASGTITAIAGAVDPTTGKIAVKVSVDENGTLKNGSTVSLSFTEDDTKTPSEIVVPLSAIKMTGSGPVAFKVQNDNTLSAIPVTLGSIKGDSVVVTQGLSLDTEIVVDARGLKEGEAVTVTTH